MDNNRDLCSFFVTKHSWKGKYKRIFSIGTACITTYHPATMEVTNRWPYCDVLSLLPVIPKVTFGDATYTAGGNELFTFTFITKKRKQDTFKFSSEYRSEILCSALMFRRLFSEMTTKLQISKYRLAKQHWSDRRLPVLIELDVAGINHLHELTNQVLTTYLYKDVDSISTVSDVPGGFIIATSGFNRLHMFIAPSDSQRDEILRKISESAWTYTGTIIRPRKEPISLEQFQITRFGRYSNDESLTSLYEFTVHKVNARNVQEPVKRTLALTDNCLIERDPNSYSIITLKPLQEVFALVRSSTNPQCFSIEYIKGQVLTYTSTDRDALLASLLDGVRASGNVDVHVKMEPTIRGYRIGPYSMPVDEEVESWHLKFLQAPPINWSFNESIIRFNANCAYSGLLHSVTQDRLFAENKEKLIKIALSAFVENEGDQDEISNEHLEQQFQCLRRLVASKAGFTSFTLCSRFRDCLGKKVVKALKRNNDAVIHSAIDMLCALMQPMHDDYDLRQEQLNKSSLLSSKEFLGSLLDVMQYHVDCGTGALVVASMLDLLTFALCPPYSETTDGNHFDVLLAMTATYGKSLFKLFQHPSLAIVKGAGLVMKAIIEEAEMETSRKMQDLALAEGAFPRHLQMALFSPESDSRYIACQHLSRQLVGLWTVDNEIAHNLLNRIFPVGLLSFLESKEKPPANWFKRPVERNNLKMAEEIGLRPKQNALTAMRDHPSVRLLEKQVEGALKHWREKIGVPKRETLQDRMAARPVILRKRRERIKCSANWSLFFYHFFQDHARPDLIWNYKTREELRDALENEIRAFQTSKELSSKNLSLAWNHREFEVLYASLANELKIGDCYLRLLLEEGEKGLLEQLENSLGEETDKLADRLRIRKPYEFFNELYHKFLLATNGPLSASCLHAMAIVYGVYHEQIGSFHDVKWLIATLGTTRDRLQRDRMLLLIRRLCVREENVKQLLDADGVRVLVDLLPLAHLHVNRAAPAASSNVLEASETMQKEQTDAQLEWHYADSEGTKQGPFSYGELKKRFDKGELNEQTRCWAQGIDGWRVLGEVAQLKWTLLASGNQMLNETQMAAIILDTLNAICDFYPSRDESGAIVRPLPRIKRRLSDQTCLPHVVQLFLTFDPSLVERVASLLVKVLEDNPAISRLYLTGAFFFMLMYSGSNVLHIGRLLHMTHLQQAFRAEERLRTSAMLQRSFLGQLLPSAMVCYLEHHGPDKFAQILLGEFDTPETIWSGEMRRLLARKLAAHVADFSPRLRSNTRALYQYCPMPAVGYPQLENELFCNAYYLKNLCDSARFANWPIREPVQLLKDILDAWKEEVNKKPSTMSSNEALRVLELDENILTQLREQEDQLTEKGISPAENAAIRKAYFKLAQKYHPDKNPEGRDRFEEINRAYEWLCGEASARNRGGPNPMHIRLMLQAQSILFQQCGVQLQAYKYAGYPMLVSTLRLETEDEKLFSKPCPLLAYACETAYHTIKCSSLNAEELRREGGLEILQAAFARCVAVLGESSEPDCVGAQVCTHIVRCFTGAAAFPACRKRLLQLRCIGGDLARLLQLDQLIRLALCTVQCVSAFAADARLSEQMVNSGTLHSLLVFLFKYDYTLEEGGVESNEQSNQQELANQLAKISLIALARLAGELSTEEMDAAVIAEKLEKAEQRKASQVKSDQLIDFAEPNAPSAQVIHAQIQRCLAALLTPFLSRQLGVASAATLLKTLTSNEQQPYLIWDNGTRAELLDFLSKGQSACSKNAISLDQLVQQCTAFVYTAHRKELVIGDVFVRVYNQQPAYQLIEPKAFTVALLDYIGSQTQYFHSADMLQRNADSPVNGSESPKNTPSSPARVANMEMALEALCNVIKHNSGVENACIGHFRLLFLLLRVQKSLQMRLLGVQLICAVSGSQECVADIAASEVLVNLLLLLRAPPAFNEKATNVAEMRVLLAQLQTAVLDALLPLMANSKLVREALTRGGVLYLLEGFCVGGGAAASGMRERCAELLAKMASDKLVGPKVRLQLMRFLPPLFVDAMNDSPSGAVQLFDASQENPELIWNEQCKASVCRTLRQLAGQLSEQQWLDQSILWSPPEGLQAEQTSLSDELQVAGVYVRLFVANPTWLLRKPKQFLTELLNQFQRLLSSDKMDEETLKLLGSGALALLSAQPALMDLLPAMGYVPELLNALANANSKPPFVVECCVRLIEQCSQSRACVDTLVQYEKLAARMEEALKVQPSLAGPVCDCLLRLLQVNGESMMIQLTSGKLVNLLMRMLDDATTGTAGKAQIVRLLKAMCECGVRGEQLAATLDKSGLWHEFRDQKHDLFISSQPTAGFITAGVPNVAGYLTQSNQTVNMQMPSDPPPIDEY